MRRISVSLLTAIRQRKYFKLPALQEIHITYNKKSDEDI